MFKMEDKILAISFRIHSNSNDSNRPNQRPKNLHKIRKVISEILHVTFEKWAFYHNDRAPTLKLDEILMQAVNPSKLQPMYIGPFEVLKKLGESSYRIKFGDNHEDII